MHPLCYWSIGIKRSRGHSKQPFFFALQNFQNLYYPCQPWVTAATLDWTLSKIYTCSLHRIHHIPRVRWSSRDKGNLSHHLCLRPLPFMASERCPCSLLTEIVNVISEEENLPSTLKFAIDQPILNRPLKLFPSGKPFIFKQGNWDVSNELTPNTHIHL